MTFLWKDFFLSSPMAPFAPPGAGGKISLWIVSPEVFCYLFFSLSSKEFGNIFHLGQEQLMFLQRSVET